MPSQVRGLRAAAMRGGVALLLVTPLPSGQAVPIADTPLLVQKLAKPNIIYVLDDSGSMNYEFLPRQAPTSDGALWWHTGAKSFIGRNGNDQVEANVLNFNKNGDASATWKKYVYLFPFGTGVSDGLRTFGDGAHDHFAIPPTPDYAWTRSSAYNALYYNPAVTYGPWEPYYDGTQTVAFAQADPARAKTHPLYGSTTVDLTAVADRGCVNCTFRMWPGMAAPAAARYREDGGAQWQQLGAGQTVPDGHYWDVRIPYYPATYYVEDAAGAVVGPGGTKLKKYEIRPNQTFPSGRSYADEMQNFANWFVYHRGRQLMVNAAVGASMSGVTGIRGGMFTLNHRSDVTMYDFSNGSNALNGKRLLKQFYDTLSGGGTPTRDALDFAGKQFMRRDAGAPVNDACQFNAAFVITDGFANNTSDVVLDVANYDGQTDDARYRYNRQYGTNLTYPYRDGFDTTLADIAMQYYTVNLRPDLRAGQVAVQETDTGPDADRNGNLHMNTYALGLGVKGTIFGTGSPAAQTPYSNPPVWPNPNAATRSPASVDDLWHATLNGRGKMLSAADATATRHAMSAILRGVLARDQAAAAVGVATTHMLSGDNTMYVTSYHPGDWSGELRAVTLNPGDARSAPNVGNPLWNARGLLDAKPAGERYIVTASGAAAAPGIQFQPATAGTPTKLSQAQQAALGGASVLAYVRGERSGEGTSFRTRSSVLGDLVNAEPVVVTAPAANYADAGYAAFKTARANRTKTVFQGANDGMLHAFNAQTGVEAWAYIPSFVRANLNNLTRKDGFTHQYFVDGKPAVADADVAHTGGANGSGDWRTLLVGGLGKGGNGYYALDVTEPIASSEANAAAKVLWEFPNAALRDTRVVPGSDTAPTYGQALGYSFGKPIIVKTAKQGWVVLVTSGYNNGADTGGDGSGYLFVLNAKSGAVIKAIRTGAGSSATPSGLAQISAYVENGYIDNTTDFVYGADLLGNLWRFDLSGPLASWTVARVATLVDRDGRAQPVTSAPELGKISVNGSLKRMVYVGTGQYLSDQDIPGSGSATAGATQPQTMYGLVDNLGRAPLIEPLRSALQMQELRRDGDAAVRTLTSNAVDFSAKQGWYLDLPIAGERISTAPVLAKGMLLFTSNIPNMNACKPIGQSWINAVDYKTGGAVADLAGAPSQFLGDVLASRPVMYRGNRLSSIVGKSDTGQDIKDWTRPPPPKLVRRMSWRELLDH
jgi:type IV pilus assembly protein PilY1